jgi:cytochrome c553
MNRKKRASILAGAVSTLKRIALLLIKAVYILPFAVFSLWLLSVVYFPGFDLNASFSLSKYAKKAAATQQVTGPKKPGIPRDHFHMTDAYVDRPDPKAQICSMCHGAYAHGKEKKVRAFLNMHEDFMACTVCHVRKEDGEAGPGLIAENEKIGFLWVDRETGEFKSRVEGEYGKYPARIFSVIYDPQGRKRLPTPITLAAARQFLELKPKLKTPEQFEEARGKLHKAITKKPISCSDCHKKDGHLDFLELGFPQQRVDHLVSTEFVGMIDKYKTFYLPSVIDFRGE